MENQPLYSEMDDEQKSTTNQRNTVAHHWKKNKRIKRVKTGMLLRCHQSVRKLQQSGEVKLRLNKHSSSMLKSS